MNYFFKILLTTLLIVSLAACGNDPEPPNPPTPIPADEAPEETSSEAEEEAESGAEGDGAEGDSAEEAAESDETAEDGAEGVVEEEAEEEAVETDNETDEDVEDSELSEEAAEEPAEESSEESSEEGDEEADGDATEAATTDTATEETASEEIVEPRVFFLQPTNNAIIPSISTIIMGTEGLIVEPAGEISEGAGHLHILVDTDFIAPGDVIPSDENHLHYGQAQLSAEVELTPGEHTLRLQFANGAHIALDGDAYRAEINVTVAEDAPAEGVYFVSPSDGETVSNPIEIIMAASGLVIEPAGEIREGAGHLHILVNTEFVAPGEVIVNDEIHLHYGKAQTETTLELEPGEYVLRLQLANGAHIALEGEQYQDEINITVE